VPEALLPPNLIDSMSQAWRLKIRNQEALRQRRDQ